MKITIRALYIYIILAAAICFAAALTFAAGAEESVVYVSSAGSDSGKGDSASSPLATMGAAMKAVKNGGVIVVCGNVNMGTDYTLPAADAAVTITSKYGGQNFSTAVLSFGGNLYLSSELVFENIRLTGSSTPIISCCANSVTFGEGITTSGILLLGGRNILTDTEASLASFDKDYTITVKSGSWSYIRGGNRRASGSSPVGTISGNVTVVIEGGTFNSTNASNTMSAGGMSSHTGNVTMIINGGTVSGDIYGAGRIGSNSTKTKQVYSGKTSIVINGGKLMGKTLAAVQETDSCSFTGEFSLTISEAAALSANVISAEGVEGAVSASFPAKYAPYAKHIPLSVYVSASGSDSNDGFTAQTAYATLKKASETVKTYGGSINISGELAVKDTSLAKSAAPVVITGGTLNLSGYLETNGYYIIEKTTLAGTGTLFAGGEELTMGEGIICSGNIALSCATSDGSEYAGAQLLIKSGKYKAVSGGSVNGLGSGKNKGSSVIFTGGETDLLCASGDNDLEGQASVTVSGGTVNGLYGIKGLTSARSASGRVGITVSGGVIRGGTVKGLDGVGSVPASFSFNVTGGDFSAISSISGAGFALSEAAVSAGFNKSLLSGFGSASNLAVVYVKDGGAGKKDGSSADNALDSLSGAIKALGEGGGVAVVCGTVTLSSDLNESARGEGITIRITSVYGGVDYMRLSGAKIALGANWNLAGDAVVENTAIAGDGKTRAVYANGHKLIIGEGVNCSTAEGSVIFPSVYGGTSKSQIVNGTSLVISSGTWHTVSAGSSSPTSTLKGASLEINGGTFTGPVSITGAGNFNGNAGAVINGGEFLCGVFGMAADGTAADYKGNINIVINGGVFMGRVNAAKNDSTLTFNGEYRLTLNGGDFSGVYVISGAEKCSGRSDSFVSYGSGFNGGKSPDGSTSLTNPLCVGLDPWITYKDGYYYLVIGSGTTVNAYKAVDIAALAYAEANVIAKIGKSVGLESVWSPEMHYFTKEEMGDKAGWYLYIACTPYGSNDSSLRRIYCLKALTDNPLDGFGSPVTGAANTPVQIIVDTDNTNWNIGPSILKVNGTVYMTWTGRIGGAYEKEHWQCIYIAELSNPWTIKGNASMICRPTKSWERGGAGLGSDGKLYPEVVEGATAVYGDDGSVYIVYSASGYWTNNYCLALLTLKRDSNGAFLSPLDMNSWEKSANPILVQGNGAYGTGHASYTTSPDGTARYFVYHGYLDSGHSGSRYTFVETYTAGSDGVKLGSGVSAGVGSVITVLQNPMTVNDKLVNFTKNPETLPAETTAPGSSETSVNTTDKPDTLPADTTAPGSDTANVTTENNGTDTTADSGDNIVIIVLIVIVAAGWLLLILKKRKQ